MSEKNGNSLLVGDIYSFIQLHTVIIILATMALLHYGNYHHQITIIEDNLELDGSIDTATTKVFFLNDNDEERCGHPAKSTKPTQ